jgi:hypothetical protein
MGPVHSQVLFQKLVDGLCLNLVLEVYNKLCMENLILNRIGLIE